MVWQTLSHGTVALLAEGVDRNRTRWTLCWGTRVALLAEGVDRNISAPPVCRCQNSSPSSRRAWIEIFFVNVYVRVALVALLAEGVDRNRTAAIRRRLTPVALLAEGVDRNFPFLIYTSCGRKSPSSRRAWIEISRFRPACAAAKASPSSRRAWIEILQDLCNVPAIDVALLAEGVDRNCAATIAFATSPVALLAEGVDRNCPPYPLNCKRKSRPPRGGRG